MEGLHISWQIFLVQLCFFMLLLFILTKLLFKPIVGFMDARTNQIKDEYKNIEDTKTEIEGVKKQYQNQLNELTGKTNTIIQQAIKTAGESKQEIIDEARKESNHMLQKATLEIELERKKAVAELYKEVSGLSVLCASKIIEGSINPDMADRLVKEVIDGLDGVKITPPVTS
ncbi:F0F1 ATP synthase subunit B [Candidatus Desantisbacteria bacterium]|nr:F0F1 ATP synthase subunit B [Candidatus Desantisbacteria bacterium]